MRAMVPPVAELERRGVMLTHAPHLDDPDGHTLPLMHEVPRGYALPR